MKILITGGAGFIGSSLADFLLKRGDKVFVIDNFDDFYDVSIKQKNISKAKENPNYKFYFGDIRDNNFLEKTFEEINPDVIVHLAALAGVRSSFDNPTEYVETNIGGTVNILNNMIKYNIKKIVFASSSSVYGNSAAEIFSEDSVLPEPISPYAETKLSCERFIKIYSDTYNIQAVCLRFFTVYGPKQRPDLAIRKFAELMMKNKPIPVYGDGTTKRDYTYIDDIIDGICASVEYNKTPFEIINLGGGNSVTLDTMIKTLEKTLNLKAQIERYPLPDGDVNKTVCDIEKARRLLNYIPKTDFETGIQKFISSLITN